MPYVIRIDLYDKFFGTNEDAHRVARLSHFTDLCTTCMGRKLERMLAEVRDAVAGKEYSWDGETVAALLVKQSAEDQGSRGIPTLKPCLGTDPGCGDVWRIFLGPARGQYDLRCFKPDYDYDRACEVCVEEVDWRLGKRI